MENIYYYIILFFIYSFVGWIIEIIYTLFDEQKLINRGFMIGPMCPIYGTGATLITILLKKYSNDTLVLFLMSIVICSILEYMTSFLMEKIFKNRWWDYSKFKFNINGRICLETMIPFGFGALVLFYGTNPIIFKLLNKIPINTIKIVAIILIVIATVDAVLSFNIIIKLKNISNSIRCDSTEQITKKVKEWLGSHNILSKRLLKSFPDMKVFNKMSLLKDKLNDDKEKLKEEKRKNRKRFFR